MKSSASLLFLRPLALPRPSAFQFFFGISRALSTSASHASSSTSTTPSQLKPYRVERTPSNNYSVYNIAKRGGNMKLTRVKKVEGDISAFKRDLQQSLGLPEKEVTINQLTKHITVKGHKALEVKKFLEEAQL